MLKDETFVTPGSFAAGGEKSIVHDRLYAHVRLRAGKDSVPSVHLPWFELRTSFIEEGRSNHSSSKRSIRVAVVRPTSLYKQET